MRVGIISIYTDPMRMGRKNRGVLQPSVGPIIAGLLPSNIDIDVINETWEEPTWTRYYDLLYLSSLHSDFDRARQISHYWRRRGAKTVYGGTLASTYPALCQPFFDSIVVGDAEGSARVVYDDFCRNSLKKLYVSAPHDKQDRTLPRFDLLAGKRPVPIMIEATRGCPFACDFCALTGIGTRFHMRSVESVVQEIRDAQHMLQGLVPWPQRHMVAFVDNNLGGSPSYLVKLCDSLAPLGIRWGAAMTMYVLSKPDIIRRLAKAGCRVVFVGLESFNQQSLAHMKKWHNVVGKLKRLVAQCQQNGILLVAGLLLNASVDDWRYVETIPDRLIASGLYMPAFISFECPIPGTPYFKQLMEGEEGEFLPNALLRDFSGYTLVVKPKNETAERFVANYKWVAAKAYGLGMKGRKLAHDIPRLLTAGGWNAALADVAGCVHAGFTVVPGRSYMAGSDTPPPEMATIPLAASDFSSDDERRAIMEPWLVTDKNGTVVSAWRKPVQVYGARGQLTPDALALLGG